MAMNVLMLQVFAFVSSVAFGQDAPSPSMCLTVPDGPRGAMIVRLRHSWRISQEMVPPRWHGDIEHLAGGIAVARTGDVAVCYDPGVGARSTVEQFIAAHEALDLPVRYDVTDDRHGVHVIPSEVRGHNGTWEPARSPLGEVVELRPGPRALGEALKELFAAIDEKKVPTIATLHVPSSDVYDMVVVVPAGARAARETMWLLLDQVYRDQPGDTWFHYYLAWTATNTANPTYVLNIHAEHAP